MISKVGLIYHDYDCSIHIEGFGCDCGADRWGKLICAFGMIEEVLAEFGSIKNFRRELSLMRRFDSKPEEEISFDQQREALLIKYERLKSERPFSDKSA